MVGKQLYRATVYPVNPVKCGGTQLRKLTVQFGEGCHAEELARFALDCLQVLEDMNVELGANSSVRIGINTGGPIIATVLAYDS
jgi:hypothetical protein